MNSTTRTGSNTMKRIALIAATACLALAAPASASAIPMHSCRVANNVSAFRSLSVSARTPKTIRWAPIRGFNFSRCYVATIVATEMAGTGIGNTYWVVGSHPGPRFNLSQGLQVPFVWTTTYQITTRGNEIVTAYHGHMVVRFEDVANES